MFKNLSHVTFLYKWVLWLIPIVFAWAGLWWYFLSKKAYPSLRISSTKAFAGYPVPLRAKIKQLLPLLRIAALTLLLVAIARPQTSFDEQKVTTEGIDIMLAIDVSGSMLSEDFTPNRIGAAKKEAMEFIDARPNDRIGMVVFSGESFTVCPLTIDHTVLKEQVDKIQNGLMEDGTAIGMGLATCVERLREAPGKSKVVILMTDGVNNRGLISPEDAANIARAFGIRVYTIGIGTIGTAPYPFIGPDGQKHYQNIPVEIDEALLRKIAQSTGGLYFRAKGNKDLEGIYAQIDKLEKTKIEVSAYQHRSEKFYAFALLAAIFLVVEMLLRYLVVRAIP